ncbi:MAG: hypothetical protein NTW25_04505 [Candidatus Kapabacteria bacterium]|nr:hypothetical protein [Candidatus Kapabacteria bacterium]
MNKKNIILNSTMLFVIATMWQQSLHEMAHFIAAIIFHSKNISLHHNYVQHDSSELSLKAKMIIASAGPLFSLLMGILFQLVCASYKKRNLLFLFFLFMSVFGYINFGGYLLVSPFFKGGDTGFVFFKLGFPIWLTIILSIGGAVFLFYAIKMLSKYFVEMASEGIINDKSERRTFINSLVKYPLYFGVIITTLLNLPVVVILSLLYPMCSPFSLFWGFGFLLDTPYPTTYANKELNKLTTISPFLIIAFIVTIICNRLFVKGLYW